jgi:threonine dehydrogenase-like Zn-dependent dehydrogenase
MKAAIFKGPGKIDAGERPDPVIVEPTDAVVRVVLACVCGSDLWYYRGDTNFPVEAHRGDANRGVDGSRRRSPASMVLGPADGHARRVVVEYGSPSEGDALIEQGGGRRFIAAAVNGDREH